MLTERTDFGATGPRAPDLHRTSRARPLPLDDRRRAIMAELAPYVVEHGLDVSTRDLAAAAGVAEGTLYRVFPDKKTLVAAAVMEAADQSLNPRNLERTTLPAADASLEEKLRTLVEAAMEQSNERYRIFGLLHRIRPEEVPTDLTRHLHRPGDPGKFEQVRAARRQLEEEAEKFLGDSATGSIVSVGQLLDIVQALTMVNNLPTRSDAPPLTASQITTIVLHGVFDAPPPGA